MAIAAGTPEEVAPSPPPTPASSSPTLLAPRRAPARRPPRRPARARSPPRSPPDAMRRRSRRRLRLWAQKWRWYERNSLPWNRAAHPLGVHAPRSVRALAACTATCSRRCARGAWSSGPGVLLEPGVWITAPGQRARADRRGELPEPRRDGRRPGAGGDRRALHARQRLLRLRRQPPLRRPERPIPWQGFESKGPTRIGANCWLGANVVVTSGVTHRRALRDRRQQRRDARHPAPSRSPPGRPRRCCGASNTGSVRRAPWTCTRRCAAHPPAGASRRSRYRARAG